MTISAQVFDAIETRLINIITANYGNGLSTLATSLAIPSNRFRLPPGIGILRDEGLSTEAFDRAVEIEWTSVASEPDPNNPLDPSGLRRARWRLHVGYLFGKEAPTGQIYLASGTTETAANALKYARRRALSDAETLASILSLPEVVGASGIDPSIVDNFRDGETVLEPLGGGRIIAITPYTMTFYRDQSQRYDPST